MSGTKITTDSTPVSLFAQLVVGYLNGAAATATAGEVPLLLTILSENNILALS